MGSEHDIRFDHDYHQGLGFGHVLYASNATICYGCVLTASVYGVDNVVSAYIHKNSSRPHMHFAWVPVTKDGRLSAKNVVTRLELKTLHPDMQRFMESSLGCKVEILLDSEKAGERILSTLGLKDYVDAKAELERLDSEIAEKKTQLNEILRQEHEARERLAELVCSAETLPSVKAS